MYFPIQFIADMLKSDQATGTVKTTSTPMKSAPFKVSN